MIYRGCCRCSNGQAFSSFSVAKPVFASWDIINDRLAQDLNNSQNTSLYHRIGVNAWHHNLRAKLNVYVVILEVFNTFYNIKTDGAISWQYMRRKENFPSMFNKMTDIRSIRCLIGRSLKYWKYVWPLWLTVPLLWTIYPKFLQDITGKNIAQSPH